MSYRPHLAARILEPLPARQLHVDETHVLAKNILLTSESCCWLQKRKVVANLQELQETNSANPTE